MVQNFLWPAKKGQVLLVEGHNTEDGILGFGFSSPGVQFLSLTKVSEKVLKLPKLIDSAADKNRKQKLLKLVKCFL